MTGRQEASGVRVMLSDLRLTVMTLLDNLSGYEFEEKMVRVFEKIGYENVRQLPKSGDKGRDVLMKESDGTAVVVECKHTESVGRPVVQKLHSATTTYGHDGDKRGMVVTTGRFTSPAREYAEKTGIELIDGKDLREIGEEIGMDMYNGRIEIICDRAFEMGDAEATVREGFGDIENFPLSKARNPHRAATLHPVLAVETRVDATFETSVGVIHSAKDRSTVYIDASRGPSSSLPQEVSEIVSKDLRRTERTVEFSEEEIEDRFDEVNVQRFGGTEEDYIDPVVERLRQKHATTVTYTGDNNVTYQKDCVPKKSDVDVVNFEPVYLPRIRTNVEVGDYDYPYEWYETTTEKHVTEDGIHRCVQCGESDDDTYTFCRNCGSINCSSHIKTERVEGEPVCTGCAVTERFALKKKYFYDEENLEEFREEYDEMAVHEKAMENKPLVGVTAVALAVLLYFVVQSLA